MKNILDDCALRSLFALSLCARFTVHTLAFRSLYALYAACALRHTRREREREHKVQMWMIAQMMIANLDDRTSSFGWLQNGMIARGWSPNFFHYIFHSQVTKKIQFAQHPRSAPWTRSTPSTLCTHQILKWPVHKWLCAAGKNSALASMPEFDIPIRVEVEFHAEFDKTNSMSNVEFDSNMTSAMSSLSRVWKLNSTQTQQH